MKKLIFLLLLSACAKNESTNKASTMIDVDRSKLVGTYVSQLGHELQLFDDGSGYLAMSCVYELRTWTLKYDGSKYHLNFIVSSVYDNPYDNVSSNCVSTTLTSIEFQDLGDDCYLDSNLQTYCKE